MAETAPGQLAAHDWSDYNITFTSAGESQKITFFSYILCYSRRQYLSVVENKQQTTLLRELIAAFIYMDGIPRAIRSDNQKACVEQWAPGQPVYNKKYLEQSFLMVGVLTTCASMAPQSSGPLIAIRKSIPICKRFLLIITTPPIPSKGLLIRSPVSAGRATNT